MPINLRSLDLNLLPIFAVLMREQHLSHSAEQLAMSQPAVSSALKRLRLHFHDELFVRSARGLIPTARAQELYQAIQPALQMIQSGCSEIKFDPQTNEQSLSISMNAASEFLIAAKLHHWLQQQAPQMKLIFQPDHLEDIPGLLKEGRLDFALDYIGFDNPQIESQPLLEEDLVLICRQNHPNIGNKISLEEFTTLPQVSLVPRSSISHKQSQLRGTPIEQLMGEQLPKRNICLHVSSFVVIPSIVASSDLIAIVPKRIAEHYNQVNFAVQCLDIPFAYPKVQMQLFWHKSRNQEPAHSWFREGFREGFRRA